MSIGNKIKELRNKSGITQKDLAEKLFVTAQAVSRWENDAVEPSIDTIRKMAEIFGVTTDELLNYNSLEVVESFSDKEETQTPEYKPVLALCENCNKPIYDSNDIVRVKESEHRTAIYCKNCHNKKIADKKTEEEFHKKKNIKSGKKRRYLSFIFGGLSLIIFITMGIMERNNNVILGGIIISIFIATLILNNNFIAELWFKIVSLSFVSMPGIIFSFSLDGFIFLIATKIILFLLSIALVIIAVLVATLIAALLSVIVYPFALIKNIRYPEESY